MKSANQRSSTAESRKYCHLEVLIYCAIGGTPLILHLKSVFHLCLHLYFIGDKHFYRFFFFFGSIEPSLISCVKSELFEVVSIFLVIHASSSGVSQVTHFSVKLTGCVVLSNDIQTNFLESSAGSISSVGVCYNHLQPVTNPLTQLHRKKSLFQKMLIKFKNNSQTKYVASNMFHLSFTLFERNKRTTIHSDTVHFKKTCTLLEYRTGIFLIFVPDGSKMQ